jgi:hypothetical protein
MKEPAQSHSDDRTDTAAAAAAACRLTWWRATLLILLVNSTLFYHGCRQSKTYFSVGAPGPFLEVVVQDSDRLPSSVRGGSAAWLLADLVLAVGLLVCVGWYLPRVARLLASRTFFATLSICVAVLNSFLISPDVWTYIAWWPTLHVLEAVNWLLSDALADQPAVGRLDVVLASRLYFLLLLTALYLVFKSIAYLVRRYLLIDPQRWWQFQLGGLMAVSVLAGTAIGLIVRILRAGGSP